MLHDIEIRKVFKYIFYRIKDLKMKKVKELLNSPHIQIALATGFSIIVMTYFSKRILSEPIGYVPLAILPFLATIYEAVKNRYKESKICTT